jgi:hypothetical protein
MKNLAGLGAILLFFLIVAVTWRIGGYFERRHCAACHQCPVILVPVWDKADLCAKHWNRLERIERLEQRLDPDSRTYNGGW